MKSCFIGADVGGTAIKLGGFTENGELIEKWSIPTRLDDRGRFILPEVSLSVREWAARRKWSIAGIGLGVPGPVTKEGKVLKCANLGWDVFSCKDKMVELTGIDNIEVANDANAAGLGESWMGAGRCYQSIVMVTLGTGIGGSIIINKKILHGFNGAAGEIGHMKVEDDEKDICGCGCSGCLEQYASAKGIVRLAKKYMKEGY